MPVVIRYRFRALISRAWVFLIVEREVGDRVFRAPHDFVQGPTIFLRLQYRPFGKEGSDPSERANYVLILNTHSSLSRYSCQSIPDHFFHGIDA